MIEVPITEKEAERHRKNRASLAYGVGDLAKGLAKIISDTGHVLDFMDGLNAALEDVQVPNGLRIICWRRVLEDYVQRTCPPPNKLS